MFVCVSHLLKREFRHPSPSSARHLHLQALAFTRCEATQQEFVSCDANPTSQHPRQSRYSYNGIDEIGIQHMHGHTCVYIYVYIYVCINIYV